MGRKKTFTTNTRSFFSSLGDLFEAGKGPESFADKCFIEVLSPSLIGKKISSHDYEEYRKRWPVGFILESDTSISLVAKRRKQARIQYVFENWHKFDGGWRLVDYEWISQKKRNEMKKEVEYRKMPL